MNRIDMWMKLLLRGIMSAFCVDGVDGSCLGAADRMVRRFHSTKQRPNWYSVQSVPDLQQAVSNPFVVAGHTIHVGGGTVQNPKKYFPANQNTSIHLKSGVRIWGGYPGWDSGTSTFITAGRDPSVYISELSGDLNCLTLGGCDDIPGDFSIATRGDNAHHVVWAPVNMQPPSGTGANGANLDGVVISGGHANGVGGYGGGIYVASPSSGTTRPVIRDCVITDNYARSYGGGAFIDQQSQPIFRNCRFQGNRSDGLGGALLAEGLCDITMLNCTFDSNIAAREGGAIECGKAATFTAVSCTFTNNTATGVESAPGNGGAISLLAGADGAITTIVNSLFIGNTAANTGHGGAIYAEMFESIVFKMTNTTLSGNTAAIGGGLYLTNDGGSATITSSIFWDNVANTDPAIHVDITQPVVSYSNNQGGWPGGSNNLATAPQFVDPTNGNYRLQCGSPCINSGDDNAVPDDEHDVNENSDTGEPTPDLDLAQRQVAVVDRGAYEKPRDIACFADTNDDGYVNVTDLLAVINAWGTCATPPTACPADIAPDTGPCLENHGDGFVNVGDLLLVMNGWGPCPEFGGGSGGMPETVSDCMNECATIYTSGSPEWADCVEKCVVALCEAGRLDPEECP